MRPSRGARLLDVCAAPGGKALHFATLAGDSEIVAADRSARRLRALRESTGRLGLPGIRVVAADGRRPVTRGGFSRVLVDAPCSNTGVLGRRPDARWRRVPEDLPRLAALQGELLDASRGQVGPGGLLIYSTCSLEPEENEEVIAAYLRRHPGDALVPADEVLPEELVHDGCLAVDPSRHSVDGAFAAAIRPGAGAFRVLA
jgi:16S rRNA (cytosine967-C5)-methyltransferase